MFRRARFKLTAWYLLIIMVISLLFSLVIYAGIDNEFRRFERLSELRVERQAEGLFAPPIPGRTPYIDPAVIVESRNRITLVLVLINMSILIISGGAAYFLAGRTLRPIKEMVDEQNRFITDSSHELRTPLTSLRSEIEVDLRNKNITLEEAKSLLNSNLEEVISLQSLSDHLMELASYQKGNGSMPFENLSLKEIISTASKKIAPLAKKKNITVKNEVKDYPLSGVRQSLIELFVILLDNAVKFSPKKKSILLTSQKTDHMIVVRVKDEGMGIAKEDLVHIFDRFYRADKSRSKETVKGYGLGLSIAQRIVDLHRGKISAESKQNKGTEFLVKLPIN